MPLQRSCAQRAIKGERQWLAARMTKPETTEGFQDSPHLFWSPWKQGAKRSDTRELRRDCHKEKNMRLEHATGISEIFTPTKIKALFIRYKF